MIARRSLLGLAGGGFAAGALTPSLSAELEKLPPGGYDVSPKEPRFGAIGNGRADDTRALQTAVNECFGTAETPHGTAGVSANKLLRIPPGYYKITLPIELTKLHGGRILGAGRFVTKIVNVKGGPVFATNGCGYSRFEGMYLESSSQSATVFDLNWDGTPGGAALQSNTFVDMFLSGGGIGVDIGAGGYMGSENIFVNCFWMGQAIAGLKTSNFNALQNTIVGGNFQACNIGVWVYRGSVPLVESVGFQLSKAWDVRVDNSANDTLTIIGCRTESSNFVKLQNGVHAYLVGCSQTQAGAPGFFLQPAGCPVTVERCVSLMGQVAPSAEVRLSVRGSSFGRPDWLSYPRLNPDHAIELEDVQYGGTPNSRSQMEPGKILRQRINDRGTFDYKLQAAE